jgi:8-oxo-dGTP pyrophosphatase MutT (NUDIX family)
MESAQISENEILEALTIACCGPTDDPYPSSTFTSSPQPAAVLIPLLFHDNEWHILYIRRTKNRNDRHGGQVAFPGGRNDPEDSNPTITALREAQEEVGLNPSDIKILGQLSNIRTITNYLVTPIVGRIPWPYPLKLAVDEVSRAFTIPLNWLADPNNREIRQRSLPPPRPSIPVIYYMVFDGEVLWGASARITLNLLKALTIRR